MGGANLVVRGCDDEAEIGDVAASVVLGRSACDGEAESGRGGMVMVIWIDGYGRSSVTRRGWIRVKGWRNPTSHSRCCQWLQHRCHCGLLPSSPTILITPMEVYVDPGLSFLSDLRNLVGGEEIKRFTDEEGIFLDKADLIIFVATHSWNPLYLPSSPEEEGPPPAVT